MDGLGYQLLQATRSYLELDTYFSMEVHTDERIVSGKASQKELGKRIKARGCLYLYLYKLTFVQKYNTEATEAGGTKNWNFPKMHTHVHGFDDIQNKGVTRNYNTKTSEKLHGPLKLAYHRTNFKNVADQVSWKNLLD